MRGCGSGAIEIRGSSCEVECAMTSLLPPLLRAKSALFDAAQRAVADLCLGEQPLALEFRGLASFGKRVLFSSLVEGESSERLRAIAGETNYYCSVLITFSLVAFFKLQVFNYLIRLITGLCIRQQMYKTCIRQH